MKRRKITRMSSFEDSSTDTSSEDASFHHLSRHQDMIYTSSEDEENEFSDNSNITTIRSTSYAEWSDSIGNQPQLTPFVATPGFKLSNRNYEKIEDIYLLLLNDEIFEIIVEETNRYAEKVLLEKRSSLDEWKPTNKNEIKQLFGLIMWMGIVKLPKIHLYWSKDPAYAQSLPSSIISRNRFKLLLRMLHFCDNDNKNANVNDRLYEIRIITDMLNVNFQKYYDPSEIVCVDATVISRTSEYKDNIKIFKLCSAPGYTITFQIHCGDKSMPTNVVMTLCRNIFGKGHTLCTGNLYTSIELARKLIAENTHLVGTMRSNHHEIPKAVIAKKLKQNEYIATESKDGLTVLKWKDKRDVLLLSTKHSDETVIVQKKGNDCIKPKIVVDYNEGKSYVNVSNQMSLYCSPLSKTNKWCTAVIFELFLNTAVANAWVICNTIMHNKITSLEFRKKLAMSLMHCANNDAQPVMPKRNHHEIKKKEGNFNSIRKRCKICYQTNVSRSGSQFAKNSTIKVVTFCDSCPDKPHLCLPCFNQVHCNMPF